MRQSRQHAGVGAKDLPNQAAIDAYVGPPREIIVGTDRVHAQDGVTPGGNPLARFDDVLRFATRAAAIAALSLAFAKADRIELAGYATPGDSITPLVYTPLGSAPNPVKPWHLQTANNRWWTLSVAEVCPEAMGADGTPDKDTTALQACQDYPAARVIRTTLKTYRLASRGLVLASNKVWVGKRTTLLMAERPIQPVGDMVLAFKQQNFEITGVTFDGNNLLDQGRGLGPNVLPCLNIEECYNFNISKCRFINWHSCGILANIAGDFFIERNVFLKNVPSGAFENVAIYVSGAEVLPSYNGQINRNTVRGSIISVNALDTWITFNRVSQWGFSAGINIAAEPTCKRIHIEGNRCFDSLKGMDFVGYYPQGIECWADDSVVANNLCWNNAGDGIGLGGRRSKCYGNTCFDNGFDTTNRWNGIFLVWTPDAKGNEYAADYCSVWNNTCYDTRPVGQKTQSNGLSLSNQGHTFVGIKVGENNFFDHRLGPYGFIPGLFPIGYPVEYTPTIAAGTGAAYTVKATAMRVAGDLYHVNIDIRFSAAGTGTSSVLASLPFTSAGLAQQVVNGQETNLTGYPLTGRVGLSQTQMSIATALNEYPVKAATSRLVMSGAIMAAAA